MRFLQSSANKNSLSNRLFWYVLRSRQISKSHKCLELFFPLEICCKQEFLAILRSFKNQTSLKIVFSCFRCAVNKKGYFKEFQHKKHTKSHNWSRIIFHALNMLQTSIFATAWPREVVARGGHPFGCKRKSLTGFFAFWTTQ